MSTHDKTVQTLLKKIEAKRQSLGKKPSMIWKTNAVLQIHGICEWNLNTVNNLPTLVECAAAVLRETNQFKEAAKVLGVETPERFIGVYPTKDWISDLKKKAKIIQWNEQKKELDSLERKLKQLLSTDGKTAAALEEISTLLT
jgi:hypothetical protein